MRQLTGIVPALLGSLLLAAVSTFGDWVWAQWIPRGEMVHGVVHGAAIFAVIGLVLGRFIGRPGITLRAVAVQMLIGALVAASFYPLYRWIGVAALVVTWMALWLLTAFHARHLADPRPPPAAAWVRGAVAAMLSGLAFWAISGIWTNPDPNGPNLAWFFLCWTFAFFPGFLALFVGRTRQPRP